MIHALFTELSALPQVEAMALGGSRAAGYHDEKSDYDVYLYCTEPVPEDIRREILGKYCSVMEIGNQFWELEDNATLKNGVDIDILYRNLDAFTEDVAQVVEGFQSRNGYTTCMWHNLLTCKILCDKQGRLAKAKERFTVPYPEELRQNILSRNLRLLENSLPAYDGQIIKAAARGDLVSINHRTAAFLESYFDVLLALNRKTHPGEKRLIPLTIENCALLPQDFEANLRSLFSHMYAHPKLIRNDLSRILLELRKIL